VFHPLKVRMGPNKKIRIASFELESIHIRSSSKLECHTWVGLLMSYSCSIPQFLRDVKKGRILKNLEDTVFDYHNPICFQFHGSLSPFE